MTTEQPFYCDKCNTTFYSIIPITECIRCSQKELSDLKAKYLKEGYQSYLREVTEYQKGWSDCLDEIKKLINEV